MEKKPMKTNNKKCLYKVNSFICFTNTQSWYYHLWTCLPLEWSSHNYLSLLLPCPSLFVTGCWHQIHNKHKHWILFVLFSNQCMSKKTVKVSHSVWVTTRVGPMDDTTFHRRWLTAIDYRSLTIVTLWFKRLLSRELNEVACPLRFAVGQELLLLWYVGRANEKKCVAAQCTNITSPCPIYYSLIKPARLSEPKTLS